MIDPRFSIHNTHLEDPEHFEQLDPQLRKLPHLRYVYKPALLDELPIDIPGIYTIGGGRQIGKTTLLKLWMAKLLEKKVNPQAIVFFSGELIDDHHSLFHLLQTQLALMPIDVPIHYILIDEVTYIRDWDKAIKYAADTGLFEQAIVIITGSDLMLIQEARVRFPGRRGKANKANFHLYPLSFREFMDLKHNVSEPNIDLLFEEFNQYLLHGGYLTAINDMALQGQILEATLTTYSDWIRGDVLKRGKQENYLREILGSIIKRYNTQVTWNALAKDLSIDHPHTVADYVSLLESMDALFMQSALMEDKLVAAPKKARKLVFTDPFIFHAVKSWIFPEKNTYESQIKTVLKDPELSSSLVEACVVAHYRRFYPTYYIKADGEVDIAYVDKRRFWPIEVKWGNQIRTKDLKQITRYQNAKIFTKFKAPGQIQGIPTEPLPLALWRLSEQVNSQKQE